MKSRTKLFIFLEREKVYYRASVEAIQLLQSNINGDRANTFHHQWSSKTREILKAFQLNDIFTPKYLFSSIYRLWKATNTSDANRFSRSAAKNQALWRIVNAPVDFAPIGIWTDVSSHGKLKARPFNMANFKSIESTRERDGYGYKCLRGVFRRINYPFVDFYRRYIISGSLCIWFLAKVVA